MHLRGRFYPFCLIYVGHGKGLVPLLCFLKYVMGLWALKY